METSQLLLFLAVFAVPWLSQAQRSSLRLTSVLFRHGDRSPVRSIPTDLHDESDWPQGYAQLSKRGVQQSYELGQFLRDWYEGFLSRRYERREVYLESTDTDRTLMTAQAVTSSLYVPQGSQVWQKGLLWQPIPAHPASWIQLSRGCRKRIVREAKARINRQFKREYKEVIAEIEAGLGIRLPSPVMLWTVYDTLLCERLHNKTWPAWVTEDLMVHMEDIVPRYNRHLYSISPDRADLLSKMIKDMSRVVAGESNDDIKAFFYSGHDTTILCLACALKVHNNLMFPYSTAVMVELHYGNRTESGDNSTDSPQEETTTYSVGNDTLNEARNVSTTPTSPRGPEWFVQVWLRNDSTTDPYKLTLPGCSEDCPWESFVELTLPAVNELSHSLSLCSGPYPALTHLTNLWRVVLVAAAAGGVVMLGVIMFSAACLYQHRKRRQRLQAIYRQLNTEDIPMADTS